jgi:hypothetical protein
MIIKTVNIVSLLPIITLIYKYYYVSNICKHVIYYQIILYFASYFLDIIGHEMSYILKKNNEIFIHILSIFCGFDIAYRSQNLIICIYEIILLFFHAIIYNTNNNILQIVIGCNILPIIFINFKIGCEFIMVAIVANYCIKKNERALFHIMLYFVLDKWFEIFIS